jgi:hypothetical protein
MILKMVYCDNIKCSFNKKNECLLLNICINEFGQCTHYNKVRLNENGQWIPNEELTENNSIIQVGFQKSVTELMKFYQKFIKMFIMLLISFYLFFINISNSKRIISISTKYIFILS